MYIIFFSKCRLLLPTSFQLGKSEVWQWINHRTVLIKHFTPQEINEFPKVLPRLQA